MRERSYQRCSDVNINEKWFNDTHSIILSKIKNVLLRKKSFREIIGELIV